MRRPSKTVAREEYERVKQHASRLERVLHLAARTSFPGGADETRLVRGKEKGERWWYELWGAMDSDGGTLVQRYELSGQNPQVDVHRFDEFKMPDLPEYLKHRIAVDELRAAQKLIWEADKVKQAAEAFRQRHGAGGDVHPALADEEG